MRFFLQPTSSVRSHPSLIRAVSQQTNQHCPYRSSTLSYSSGVIYYLPNEEKGSPWPRTSLIKLRAMLGFDRTYHKKAMLLNFPIFIQNQSQQSRPFYIHNYLIFNFDICSSMFHRANTHFLITMRVFYQPMAISSEEISYFISIPSQESFLYVVFLLQSKFQRKYEHLLKRQLSPCGSFLFLKMKVYSRKDAVSFLWKK